MENTEQAMVVFKDHGGDYYLLPQALLEAGRVPAERKTEVERLIAEEDDAQGHWWVHAVLTPAAVIGTGAVLIYQELTKGSGGSNGSAHWSYFEQAYNQAKLQ